jgi:hypothetical protein
MIGIEPHARPIPWQEGSFHEYAEERSSAVATTDQQ